MKSITVPQPADLERQVRLEKVRMMYQQMATSVTGTMVGVALLVGVLWSVQPPALLLAWAACMGANQAWRLMLFLRFRRENIALDSLEGWARRWLIGAAISGAVWAAAGALFFVSDSPLHQMVLFLSIFAITSVAVPLLAAHRPSFYIFVIPTLGALILRSAWEGEPLHLLLAFITTSVLLGILAVGRKYNQLLTESLRTRFQNEAMARHLATQNAELERARNTAEMASRAKTQFFAAASHDLRQPLHAMGLFAAALADKARDPEVRNMVDSINASVDALESLFNELLDISKIDAGAIRPKHDCFSLRPLLERLRLDFTEEARLKGLKLRVRPSGAMVCSDALLLERVLRNLINNAIRYTPSGGILVGVRRRAERWRIEVWDTGIGIPIQQHEKVFEEFYQIGNVERDRRKGLGLGLSIVRRLAELLEHPLAMRSREQHGTVFAIELPAACAQPPAPGPAPEALPPTGLDGRLILVVDDEESVREGMQALLGGWGAEVVACAGVADTVVAANKLPRAPDLVIADYQLGQGTAGPDAIRAVRARFGGQVPAILITGSASPLLAGEAQALGCHLLLKPVMPAKLRSLLNATLLA
ncbi:MAG: hybrid sensor histidine kinase/response regulator [Rhodocyclaceae bacterium]|nr:hybrid sensor histidine kinase/response regulator [Rhodocyclaceae bacterium]